MKPLREQCFADVYEDARELAAAETGIAIETFSDESPFTLDQAMDKDFWPEAAP